MTYKQQIETLYQDMKAQQNQELSADEGFKDAQQAHNKAQGVLEREIEAASNMTKDPSWLHWTPGQRESVRSQWAERVHLAKDVVEAAEEATQKAVDNFYHSRREAEIEIEKKEQRRQADDEQVAHAAAAEAAAKAVAMERYISVGGTPAQFAAAWPDMWREELKKRAQAGHNAMIERMLQSGRYAF